MNERIEISRIRTDGGCQPRSTMLFDVVEDYANDMARGTEFPPVVVFYDGTDYWLADGYHRRQAAEVLGLVDIAADVRQGTRRDAILFSVGANAAHGMRRTNEDKRRSVLVLLNDPEWARWSDREISRQCGVDNAFVSKIRPKPVSVDGQQIEEQPRLVSRNGTTYPMDTARIGRPEPDWRITAQEQRRSELEQGSTPPPHIDLSASYLWHALRDAVDAIKSLPSPEETAARFPQALAHALRSEDVNMACSWLTEFAELWAAGQVDRDAHTATVIQRAKEISGYVSAE